jgi:DNA-binding transcriptional regulator LsrR (DeoR family)
MIGVEKIGEIRRAYFEQHRSIKEIVRTLSVSRATVRKVVRGHQTSCCATISSSLTSSATCRSVSLADSCYST